MTETATPLASLLHRAQQRQLLPADAVIEPQDTRPWPVVLLTALGAWLAAIPLIGSFVLLLGDIALRGPAPYLVGAILLAVAVNILRSRQLPVFVEQLAVPALLVGGGLLAFGLGQHLPTRAAAAALGLLALALAAAIPRAWLRTCLGALAAVLALFALAPGDALSMGRSGAALWLPLHVVLAAGLAAWVVQARGLARGDAAAAAVRLEPIAAGWIAAALVALTWWSGMTFLAGGVLGQGVAADAARLLVGRGTTTAIALHAASALFAAAAAVLAGRSWPTLRHPAAGAVALVAVALAGFMPALGAALLALAAAAVSGRWRIAGLGALAAAWIVGAFYYQLDWPLATKALVLAGAGALLATLAWRAQRRSGPGSGSRGRAASAGAPLWIAASVVATLAFANYGIWEKERLIAAGDKVYVALAPVDPRSLMQGDYMRLQYRLPQGEAATPPVAASRPYVVARRDARGVAELVRLGRPGERLAAGEFPIELTPRAGGWTLVSDAWFFPEGDAKRWEAARFAEFRVDPLGHALLVGLADQQLHPIAPAP